MKRVYIDLGAFTGDTLEKFGTFDEAYAFEPNPKCWQQLTEASAQYPYLLISNKAAWIEDGEMWFAVDPSNDSPFGSTLMQSKAVWKVGEKVMVSCFDFSTWLKRFEGCYVVVKMDIEGAEFPVLEKMLADGTIDLVSELHVEFHANKVPEYTTTQMIALRERLKQHTKFFDWH
jgi:FkbM family methyltransferase